ncbi:hypothetical protein PR048_023434, partial [Dryococelus australis]
MATKEICHENTATLSIAKHILYSIDESLRQYITDHSCEHGLGVRLARSLVKSLSAHFHSVTNSQTYRLNTALDPRLKTIIMEKHEHEITRKQLVTLCKKCRGSSVDVKGHNSHTKFPSAGLWSFFEKKTLELQQGQRLIEHPVIGHHEEPLIWWQANKKVYPILALLTQHYLGISVTSVCKTFLECRAGDHRQEREIETKTFRKN